MVPVKGVFDGRWVDGTITLGNDPEAAGIASVKSIQFGCFVPSIADRRIFVKSLDLDTVKAFVLTAELQSFTRAAQLLDSHQSAISLRVRRLEEQLGQRLLVRTPRKVSLSAEGASFLEPARRLLAAHDQAMVAITGDVRRLTVGISQLIAGSNLPAVLTQLNAHDPRLLIELHVAGSRELLQSLQEGGLDAALVVQPPERRGQGDFLFSEPFDWIAARGWRADPERPLPLSTQGEACGVRNAAVRALDHAGIPWAEVFIGKGAAAVGAAAAAGLAVAVLARHTVPAGTTDVGEDWSLPRLQSQDVVLYSRLNDPRSRAALDKLTAAMAA